MRAAVVVAMVLGGCAMGYVARPGRTVVGVAVGSARVVDCDVGGFADSASDGLLDGPCIEVAGGTLSSGVTALLGTLGTLAAGYFTGILP